MELQPTQTLADALIKLFFFERIFWTVKRWRGRDINRRGHFTVRLKKPAGWMHRRIYFDAKSPFQSKGLHERMDYASTWKSLVKHARTCGPECLQIQFLPKLHILKVGRQCIRFFISKPFYTLKTKIWRRRLKQLLKPSQQHRVKKQNKLTELTD